jgi:HAD superfamily hydrolase (TIGR01509 family)
VATLTVGRNPLGFAQIVFEVGIVSQLEALIFDVDGTLSDTERDGHRVAFNKAFAEAGLDWDWSVGLYGELLAITGGKERIRHFLGLYHPEMLSEEGIDERIAHLHKRKTAYYLELLETGAIPLRSGVERLLRQSRDAGLRLAIATTTTPENVTTLLKATLGEESIGWFEVIAAGDIVPAKKPAPDIYVYALEEMALRADQCLALEDSYNGVQSATGSDLPVLITVNGYTREDDFTGSLTVLDQFGEPEDKATVLSGAPIEADCVTPDVLKALHQAAQG